MPSFGQVEFWSSRGLWCSRTVFSPWMYFFSVPGPLSPPWPCPELNCLWEPNESSVCYWPCRSGARWAWAVTCTSLSMICWTVEFQQWEVAMTPRPHLWTEVEKRSTCKCQMDSALVSWHASVVLLICTVASSSEYDDVQEGARDLVHACLSGGRCNVFLLPQTWWTQWSGKVRESFMWAGHLPFVSLRVAIYIWEHLPTSASVCTCSHVLLHILIPKTHTFISDV